MTKRDLKSLVIPLFTIVLSKNFSMTKNCFYCSSHRTIKKSKENGYLRWFCKDCKRYFIGHR
ncbi:IS1/IS1595 family N-terminal zinc-binding domain-containing protein [Prevotella sp.]